MKFAKLSKYLDKLEITSSRNEITGILADLFKETTSSEIDKVTYLILGILAPSYQGVVMNIADRMMLKVLSRAYKKDAELVKKLFKEEGDIGKVAQKLAKEVKATPTVNEVYEVLYKIANDIGVGSQERKVESMAKLLSSLDPLSARFVARIPVGRLRLGFSDKTIIDALSYLEAGDKSKSSEIEKAYEVLPDVGKLAQKVKEKGIKKATANISPELGVPVLPMLPQRLKSPEEMIAKMSRVSVEPKFDGLRALIHYKKGKNSFAKVFTRNLNDVSPMFTEIPKAGVYVKASEAILDAEAVGLDPKTKKFFDFQTTMQRRRKHEIEKISREIPLRFQVFDVLYIDGENLMNKSYLERREILKKIVKKNPILVIDENIVTSNPSEIREKHKELLARGLEGVIVKRTDSTYVPGRTGWRWVKMKEVEEARGKLVDTLDCVIMGFTSGMGKRAGFGIGQFLAGVLDKDKFKTITKVGTGLSDEQFRELAARLKKLIVNDMPKEYDVHKDLAPDFWVIPEVVVELAADEITKSPKHTAGFALRFPRLVKFRDDKSSYQATTIKEVKKLYILQRG